MLEQLNEMSGTDSTNFAGLLCVTASKTGNYFKNGYNKDWLHKTSKQH